MKVETILWLGTLQGLLLALAAWAMPKANRRANQYLSALVCLVALTSLARLSYEEPYFRLFPQGALLADVVLFGYGPLLYFYTRSLLATTYTLSFQWLHALPITLHVCWMLPLLFLSPLALQSVLQEGSLWYALVELAALVHVSTYVAVSYWLVNQRRAVADDENHDRQTYLMLFLRLTTVCLVAWLVGFLARYWPVLQAFRPISYNFIWLTITAMTYGLGYLMISRPALFQVVVQRIRHARTTPLDTSLQAAYAALIVLMEQQKPYLQPDLTLTSLAAQTAIKPHLLSRLINEQRGQHFSDFINSCRIDEFKQRIRDGQHETYTLLSIAFAVGFNSKSTFNAVFRKQEGISPSEYVSRCKRRGEVRPKRGAGL
jgi:AraC-like DNA-binding protein